MSSSPRWRLMFGSDWPVCLLAASYHDVTALAVTTLSRWLGPGEMGAVLGANAVTSYRLRTGMP